MAQSATPPQLAPPGAGLPAVELVIANVLFALRRIITSRAQADAHFLKEMDLILALTDKCPAAQLNQPVLIKRLVGIEDSSRYWSVWMTLEHLRIVNLAMMGIVLSLSKGIVPTRPASTAAVKPSSDLNAEVVEAFRSGCQTFITSTQAIQNLKTAKRFRHPWFGSLDASGWHAMASVHMKIHRHQIEHILAGMMPM